MSANRRSHRAACWVSTVLAVSVAGCNEQPAAPPQLPARAHAMAHVISPIDVTRIDLGTAVKPDGTIAPSVTIFQPTDTIHAAVTTERPAHDIKLTAKWVFQDDSVIKEDTRTINPTDTLITDFQVTDDAGWPPGRYKLEMLVNGNMVAVTAFEVRKPLK